MANQVYIVEDHPVMRQGYAAIIDDHMDLEICGTTGSATKARRSIPEIEPDLVIVDLSLEEGSGLELIKDLQVTHSDLPILVISMHDEALYADRALQAGARGYLMKSEAQSNVVRAIRRILDRGVFLSEAMRTKLLLRSAGVKPEEEASPLGQLSDRELEVFEYLGQGFTIREIAEKLALSPKTVNTYRTRLKEKLATESNAELRRRAVIWMEGAAP